ncbi:hypothetical protein [Methyloprofundus sp.]|uniref:hypothetical protein n=1 Tax=Methyloprofundus sp. TaxID=2020875 RepID=UPI003D0CBB6F
MTDQNIKLELNKMLTQQQQWHDEFELKQAEFAQREKHWWWQRGFWLVVASISLTALLMKLLMSLPG